MFFLIICKTPEAQAAGSERVQKAELGFMPAAVGHMHSVLLQRSAECSFQQSGGKTEFGRALGDDCKAREEGFRVGFALPCYGRNRELADSARMVNVPKACFGGRGNS